MPLKSILILILLLNTAFGQGNDPDKIIERVKSNFDRVRDYEAKVKIKIDVDFIKAPVSEATIYYKQPGMINIKSDKFALIPREGLDFSPVSLLKGEYTALFERNDKIQGRDMAVIKVIPLGDRGDIILSTLWIDKGKDIIRKIETSTKTAGTFSIDLNYDENKTEYPLPSSLTFTFNLEQMNLPKGMTGEAQTAEKPRTKDKNEPGKVYVNYSEYKVNKGIPDSMFDQKLKK